MSFFAPGEHLAARAPGGAAYGFAVATRGSVRRGDASAGGSCTMDSPVACDLTPVPTGLVRTNTPHSRPISHEPRDSAAPGRGAPWCSRQRTACTYIPRLQRPRDCMCKWDYFLGRSKPLPYPGFGYASAKIDAETTGLHKHCRDRRPRLSFYRTTTSRPPRCCDSPQKQHPSFVQAYKIKKTFKKSVTLFKKRRLYR